MKLDNEVWRKETSRRFNLVARFFKPKENVVIFDFMNTAEDVSKEEAEEVKNL